MANVEIISETPINVVELKNELARIKKRDKELNYRANKAEEFLSQSVQTPVKTAQEIYDGLVGLKIPRLKDIHIHKLIDLLPKSPEEVKVVLQGYNITVTQDNFKKIVSTITSALK